MTVAQSGENYICFGNAAGESGFHSYYISFNDCYNSCIQFVFPLIYLCINVSKYLYINTVTDLQIVCQDWLLTMPESNLRSA
jgi:hypothetical protein